MERHTLTLILGLLLLQVHTSQQTVPKQLWQRLGNMTNANDVINQILAPDRSGHSGLFTETGGINPDVATVLAGRVATPDRCQPKLRSVSIPPEEGENAVFFPTCVALQRCGGCGCGPDMLECAATTVTIKPVEVMRMTYSNDNPDKFVYDKNIVKEMEVHVGCACRCRVQPHHCHKEKHTYEEHSCRCRCNNEHLATSCPNHKLWSDQECGCVCPPQQHKCLDDEYYSNVNCRCEVREEQFVKIIDVTEPKATDACSGRGCRGGFRPVAIGDICICTPLSSVQVQSGSIGGGVPSGERVPVPPIERPSWERVPNHPQVSPPRRPRQRRPRPQRQRAVHN